MLKIRTLNSFPSAERAAPTAVSAFRLPIDQISAALRVELSLVEGGAEAVDANELVAAFVAQRKARRGARRESDFRALLRCLHLPGAEPQSVLRSLDGELPDFRRELLGESAFEAAARSLRHVKTVFAHMSTDEDSFSSLKRRGADICNALHTRLSLFAYGR